MIIKVLLEFGSQTSPAQLLHAQNWGSTVDYKYSIPSYWSKTLPIYSLGETQKLRFGTPGNLGFVSKIERCD